MACSRVDYISTPSRSWYGSEYFPALWPSRFAVDSLAEQVESDFYCSVVHPGDSRVSYPTADTQVVHGKVTNNYLVLLWELVVIMLGMYQRLPVSSSQMKILFAVIHLRSVLDLLRLPVTTDYRYLFSKIFPVHCVYGPLQIQKLVQSVVPDNTALLKVLRPEMAGPGALKQLPLHYLLSKSLLLRYGTWLSSDEKLSDPSGRVRSLLTL